jgi:hypothetical protein
MRQLRCVVAGVVIGSALVLAIACGSSTPDPAPSEASTQVSGTPPTTSAPPEVNAFSGVYQIAYDDGTLETWTARPCGTGCADVDQNQFGLVQSTIKGQAHLEGATWKLTVQRIDAVDCGDGNRYEGANTWTWDAATLRGTLTGNQFTEACDRPAGAELDKIAFTLTKQSSGVPPPGYRVS